MTSRKINLPDQGARMPRSRRESGTVPAALPSSSNVGLGEALPTGASPERTTVEGVLPPGAGPLRVPRPAGLRGRGRGFVGPPSVAGGSARAVPLVGGMRSAPSPSTGKPVPVVALSRCPPTKRRRVRGDTPPSPIPTPRPDSGAEADESEGLMADADEEVDPGEGPSGAPEVDPSSLRGYEYERHKREQWGIPRLADPQGDVSSYVGRVREALDYLGNLRCFPAYKTSVGAAQVKQLGEARSHLIDADLDLQYLEEAAGVGGLEGRICAVETQIRGIKAVMARIERSLEKLVSREQCSVRVPQQPPPPSSSSRPGAPRGKGKKGVPPATTVPPEGEWTVVAGRKKKKKGGKKGGAAGVGDIPTLPPAHRKKGAVSAGKPPPTVSRVAANRAPPQGSKRRRAVPQNPVVSITATGERTYASIMKEAVERVDLSDVGIDIERLAIKRARNGGLLLEVSGPDGADKADRLARDLEDVLSGSAQVSRPVKLAELRITGLDDSISVERVQRAVCALGGCDPSSVRMGEIRRSAGGLGAVWVRCPLPAALKVESGGRISLGWSMAGVQLLEERPLQCYRCLAFGHMAAACKSTKVRAGRCFRCGGADHVAKGCGAPMHCTLCADSGANPGHRMGGRACKAAQMAGVGNFSPPIRRANRPRRKEGGGEVKGPNPEPRPPRKGKRKGAAVVRTEVPAAPSLPPRDGRRRGEMGDQPSLPMASRAGGSEAAGGTDFPPVCAPSVMEVEEEGGVGDNAGVRKLSLEEDEIVQASGRFLTEVGMGEWEESQDAPSRSPS